MSVVQLATPLGVMIGYTVSGYMSAAGAAWQVPLLLQCACRCGRVGGRGREVGEPDLRCRPLTLASHR